VTIVAGCKPGVPKMPARHVRGAVEAHGESRSHTDPSRTRGASRSKLFQPGDALAHFASISVKVSNNQLGCPLSIFPRPWGGFIIRPYSLAMMIARGPLRPLARLYGPI
jgi:hypothetical protein